VASWGRDSGVERDGGGPSRRACDWIFSDRWIIDSFSQLCERWCRARLARLAAIGRLRVAIGSRRILISGVNFSLPSTAIFHSRGFGVSSVRSTTPVSGLNVATRSPRECNRASPRAERWATRRAVMLPGAGARPHRSPTSQSPRVQKACQKAPDDESESPRTRICAPAPGSRVVSPRRTRRLTLEPPHRHRQRSPPRIRRRSPRPARSSAPRFVAPRQTLPILRSARRCHRARVSA